MASTGLPVLDKAERGELDMCGGLVEEPTPQIDERATHPPSGMEAQPQESVAQVQNEELEHVSGPIGLARVKDYDRRFAFYPSFSVERSIALEFRAEGISRLSMEIQHLRKELKPGAASKLSNPNPTDVAEEKMEVLLSRLAESVAQYDAAWVNAKIIDNTGAPEDSSLQQLRLWLDQRSSGQVDMYRDKEWHEFRMLALEKGPIEKLVKAIMPLTRIGRIILRPFRFRSLKADDLQFLRYEDAVLSWVVGVLLLVGICVFLVLPLALLAYFDSSRNLRTVLVLVMCFLVSILARVIETDEARQVTFVCVYSAVISGFLSQMP